jgi:hypothetical protein
LKIKGQSAPLRPAATVAPASSKKTPAAPAPLGRAQKLEGPRIAHNLKGEGPTNWKDLAGVSKAGLFGQTTGVAALAERYGMAAPTRPAEKFLERVAFIDEAVRGSRDPEKAAGALLNHDYRSSLRLGTFWRCGARSIAAGQC